MKSIRRIGLTIIALSAIAAVQVSSASATAPSFGRCVKQAGGTYANAGCSVIKAGANKFAWVPGVVKPHFSTKLKEGTPLLETAAGTKITCSAAQGAGEISGEKTVRNVTMKFNGCQTSTLPCQNGAAEEINTNVLDGELGVEKLGETAAKNKLGLDLKGQTTEDLADFTCAGIPIRVRGSVIRPFKTNAMILTETVKFAQSKSKQKPEKFVGLPKDTLETNTNGGPFERAGLALIALSTYEEKIEASSIN